MDEYAYVYILANGFKKLYIGITTEIEISMSSAQAQRNTQTATPPNTTSTSSSTSSASPASPPQSAREKQLKGWLRIRKLQLIISTNPTWMDLSAEWGKPMKPYAWTENPAKADP